MLIWNDRFPVASTLALKKPPWASSLLRIETARLGRPLYRRVDGCRDVLLQI